MMTQQQESEIQLLFEESIRLTGITDYGLDWSDLVTGKTMPGPEGARFDISFEGRVNGPDIEGTIEGVDYLTVRADGKFMLDIRAAIVTSDGKRIAVYEDGVLYPNGNGMAGLQLNLRFNSSHREYAWLNNLQVWALGTVDQNAGTVKVKAYTGDFKFEQEVV